MRIYTNWDECYNEVLRDLAEMGIVVRPKTMQDKNVEGNPDYETKELQNYSYTLLDPKSQTITGVVQPWADAEFITNLAAKHKAAVGSPSTGVLPQARASGAAEDGPMTAAQYTAAVRDPKYSKDKAWAASVDRRRLAGINKGL